MKHAYLLLLLLLALPGRGQNFCPFRPGRLVEFTRAGNDTTEVIQLLRNGEVMPGTTDSIYTFNRAVTTRSGSRSICSASPYVEKYLGLLGSVLLLHEPNTMQVSYEIQGLMPPPPPFSGLILRPILLKPRMPLRQPWVSYCGNAQITAKRVALVLGQLDSVVDIEFDHGLSRNPIISLSKNHGLIRGYQFTRLVDQSTCPPYSLTAWPQQSLGTPKVGVRAVYDYQVGDVLLYLSSRYGVSGAGGFSRFDYYFGDSVLARTNSRTGDTITYRMYTRSRATGSLVTGIRTVVYSVKGSRPWNLPTKYIRRIGPLNRGVIYARPAVADPTRNGRAVQQLSAFSACVQDTTFFREDYNPDQYYIEKYGAGLGMVLLHDFDFFGLSTKIELVAFRKGVEQAGPINLWRRGLQALPTRATRPAATTAAYPQPFGSSLTVKFALARPQLVTLALRDALGRAVLVRPATAQPAGPQQLDLDTQNLPAGLYTLHLAFEGEGRAEMLKVLKSN